MPATALAAAIRTRQLSPVEIVQAVFARIAEVNPKINAFCTLTEERALRAARDAELDVMRGSTLGPLQGLPISIKDLLLTRGVRKRSAHTSERPMCPKKMLLRWQE
jgi:Asp-tRNA(Asn)/Glu-tRNA(Gln) amidotransferase A subunit family amidase